MSLINDYTIHVLQDQRRSELMARAAEERLARSIPGRSTPWWRLVARFTRRGTGSTRPAIGGVQIPGHRVAH